MNQERIAAEAQHLHMSGLFDMSEDIELYTDYFLDFFEQLIEKTVPLIKLNKDYFCS